MPFRKISRLIRPASDYRPNATHSLRYLDTGISVARVQACVVLGPRSFRTNFPNAFNKPNLARGKLPLPAFSRSRRWTHDRFLYPPRFLKTNGRLAAVGFNWESFDYEMARHLCEKPKRAPKAQGLKPLWPSALVFPNPKVGKKQLISLLLFSELNLFPFFRPKTACQVPKLFKRFTIMELQVENSSTSTAIIETEVKQQKSPVRKVRVFSFKRQINEDFTNQHP